MSVAACAGIVQRGDPDRFLATMAAPVPAREILFPIYAFNVEVARAPWVSAEPLIGEMRIQWWRDAIDEIASVAAPRAHEVVTPLAGVAARGRLPLDVLERVAAAQRAHLDPQGFADAAAFERFIDATGGGVMWAAAAALGAGAELEARVRDVGWAVGLAAWFRAVPELEARGRRPLPDGRPETVRALAAEGLVRLARARGAVPKAVRPALLAGWRAGPTLRRAASAPACVAAGRVAESEFRRRASLLQRALGRGW